jgi:hypothetical protein
MEGMGMAIDPAGATTRRALLAAAVGSLGAKVTGALGRPAPADAADGDAIHVGETVLSSDSTQVSTTGTHAFIGASSDPDGVGVAGLATSPEGQTVGVAGEVASVNGVGVLGRATATSGISTGVSGVTASPEGVGVSGSATAASGGIGVFGRAAGVHGVAVVGDAPVTTGRTTGVLGKSLSPEGHGVMGLAGGGTGVLGYSGAEPRAPSSPATGVHGVASDVGGRGGIFEGRAAQIRIVPSSKAHPPSGERGDLFADSGGGLWFCTGGTDWKRLA